MARASYLGSARAMALGTQDTGLVLRRPVAGFGAAVDSLRCTHQKGRLCGLVSGSSKSPIWWAFVTERIPPTSSRGLKPPGRTV